MSPVKKTKSKQWWFRLMNRLCKEHTGNSWRDLCGDSQPWESAYEAGNTPKEFILYWIEKYGLIDLKGW